MTIYKGVGKEFKLMTVTVSSCATDTQNIGIFWSCKTGKWLIWWMVNLTFSAAHFYTDSSLNLGFSVFFPHTPVRLCLGWPKTCRRDSGLSYMKSIDGVWLPSCVSIQLPGDNCIATVSSFWPGLQTDLKSENGKC